MPVTVRGGDILFNDGSTQSTAATTGATFTATDAIGSVMVLAYSANYATLANGRKPGDSISGSSLFRCTSGNSGVRTDGGGAIVAQLGNTVIVRTGGADAVGLTVAFTANQFPSGSATWTPCSGTWRTLSSGTGAYYDGYGVSRFSTMLCIRIA